MKDKCRHCGKIGLGVIDPETEERVVLCLDHLLRLYLVEDLEAEHLLLRAMCVPPIQEDESYITQEANMGEHVHEWNITGTPAMFVIVCSGTDCAEELTIDEVESRINACERLTADEARIALIATSKFPSEFGEIRDDLVDSLQSYADMLEPKQVT